jgi:hypothetical protein
MDSDIRYQLVTIRQHQLRAEADAVRLAATGRAAATASTAADHVARPFGALRRLLGASTSLVSAAD